MRHVKLFEQYEYNTESTHYPKINMSTEDAFEFIDYRDSYSNLYPGYEDDDYMFDEDDENDYYYDTKDIAYSAVNEILDMFESMDDNIPVYRTISVKSLNDVDRENLGECWSSQEHSALAFGSHIKANVLMSGKINSQYVNWEQTIECYFLFSGSYSGDDENEIRVDYPENIQDLEIKWIGK